MGNMRLQPEPFHMLQEFDHRNKHCGVNPAPGEEAPPFQEDSQIIVPETSFPILRLACSSTGKAYDHLET